jgi:hypothetical protein
LFEIEQKQEEGVKRKRVERLKKIVSNKKVKFSQKDGYCSLRQKSLCQNQKNE